MKTIATFAGAMEVLLHYSPRDMKGKYQLGRIQTLLEYLGNPQESFKSIHIAGTSGKTSTAYFVRGFLEAAGCKTGLTVSPHIVAINERVQVSGLPLEEARFLEYLNDFLRLLEMTDLKPTYFELLIALAYRVFAYEKVDYAVIETGLGGLLDGTNTISRADKVCVITDIGLDHTEVLGTMLQLIAEQKAGIIQPHNYVLVREQSEEVMEVFERVASTKDAQLEIISDMTAPSALPEFQHGNWALALAVYNYISQRDKLSEITLEQREAVAHQTPPGRGEIYRINGKTVILDGAHNPQKLEALLYSLKLQHITSAAVLANFIESPGSKLQRLIALLLPLASYWVVPEFSAGQDLKSRHSFAARQIVDEARSSVVRAEIDTQVALEKLLARPEQILLITGSLYLVSLLRPELIRLQGK